MRLTTRELPGWTIRTTRVTAFVLKPGTARFSRGLALAVSHRLLFSLNPRGLALAFRIGDRWHSFNRVWAPVAAPIAVKVAA